MHALVEIKPRSLTRSLEIVNVHQTLNLLARLLQDSVLITLSIL